MSSKAGSLKQEFELGLPSLDLLRACMNSNDIADRAVAYDVLTEFKSVSRSEGFEADRSFPRFCLHYLLDCIRLNLQPSSESDVLSRGDALFELTVPLASVWKRRGVAIENDEFWKIVERFLKDVHPEYIADFVTHFLEGADPSLEFRKRARFWSADAVLSGYLDDLNRTLGH